MNAVGKNTATIKEAQHEHGDEAVSQQTAVCRLGEAFQNATKTHSIPVQRSKFPCSEEKQQNPLSLGINSTSPCVTIAEHVGKTGLWFCISYQLISPLFLDKAHFIKIR